MSTQPQQSQGMVVHPPIPLGFGSYIGLSGISGTVAVFLIAWGENHWRMTSPIAALGVAAAVSVVGFVASRSHQAAALIARVGRDLDEVGVTITPVPPPPPDLGIPETQGGRQT